jgi:hypothetical protein
MREFQFISQLAHLIFPKNQVENKGVEYSKTILLIQYVHNSFDYLIETLAILILNDDQIENEEVQHSSDTIKSSMVSKVSYRSVSY